MTQAAYVGFSMGGQIAQIAAAYLPGHVTHTILMGTSLDFEPGFLALEGKPSKEGLSSPCKDYVTWVTEPLNPTALSPEERLNRYIKTWWHLDGRQTDFDAAFFEHQGQSIFALTGADDPYPTHARAMKASYNQHAHAPQQMKCPTLIIQGALDPVFPLDHADPLHNKIKGSELIVWDDFGYALSPRHFKRMIEAIDLFIQTRP
ncbi:MAG: alpha/beta hydrolase [Alphaproteobacteria bacterium]|nr:alpha/beta hydrolase [Alphaproteobacteria bacterium]